MSVEHRLMEGPSNEIEINKGDLISRGWTEGAIKKFLPAPLVERRCCYRHGHYLVYSYDLHAVEKAEREPAVKAYLAGVRALQRKRAARVPIAMPLLDAIREVSWSAHRWRDAAEAHYRGGCHGPAGHARRQKERLYHLKDRGIAAAFQKGLLRYAGTSPQGMAVYEYGEGGNSCFHSCLHPAGVECKPVEGHPLILKVKAKPRKHAMADAEFTLSALPEPGEEFERTSPPQKPGERRAVMCYQCGEEGHIARDCPDREDGEDWDLRYIPLCEASDRWQANSE